MLRGLGSCNREDRLNGRDRRQKLQTKKTCAGSQRGSRHLDRIATGLNETALDHIASIMGAVAVARLTAFRIGPMGSFRRDQTRCLQSAMLSRRQPKGQQDNRDDVAERGHCH